MKEVDFSETSPACDLKLIDLMKIYLWEKVKTVDFSKTIAACDLKIGTCRQLIEIMKVCEYLRSCHFCSIYFPGFVYFVLY